MNNGALTLKEVKELKVGDWAWVKFINTTALLGYVNIVDREFTTEEKSEIFAFTLHGKFWTLLFSEYGKTWLCYHTKEDIEQKECLSCKGTYFQDIGFDIDCEARGIELNYCPECGRKLHD